MEDLTRGTPKRRALLQRSALLIGGALGFLGGAAGSAGAATMGPTLRLFGRRRARTQAGRGPRSAPAAPSVYGELLAEVGGPRVGTFHSNGLGQQVPLHGLAAAPPLELQTFTLEHGTLFGLGASPGRDAQRTCAVLGGTGRFAGASGTYVERPASEAGAGRGAVEFVFTLKA